MNRSKHNDKRFMFPALILGVAFTVLMAVIHFEDSATHKKADTAYINYLLKNRGLDRQRIETDIAGSWSIYFVARTREQAEERERRAGIERGMMQ